ncbi:hypothetical protein HUJ04_003965 [Dendroctonus ponderosae]|nr:hypothetical protein HUJ04_003965 [Dendroctonus ponderosae]
MWEKIYFFVIAAILAITHAGAQEAGLVEKLQLGFEELKLTRTFPSYLNETLRQLAVPHFFRRSDPIDVGFVNEQTYGDKAICSICYAAANFLIFERRNNVPLEVIALEAAAVCVLLGIEDAEVCTGVIDLNLPIFAYLVDADESLQGERICDVILQKSGCNQTTFEWSIDIPEGQTVSRKNPSNPESTFNILQISDFHYDPLYMQGKTKACTRPVCCQSDQEDGDASEGTACGYWSEYNNVDASEVLVDESIRKANEFVGAFYRKFSHGLTSDFQDFEYVYFTGDIVTHRVWSTSVENNTRDMKLIFRKMKSAFSGKPIYPILGNHEPTPLNEFAIGDDVDAALNTDWLYQLIISEFSTWLPKSAKQEIKRGGYYSVSPREGFRIIALNSNVAYTMNWWLIHNDTDPFGQLTWLAQTLKEAEERGEIVHILSHIPSGKADLLQVWSREYHRIIERFSNTIAAQFNGHTHKDQFMVYHSSANVSEAINIAINGASVICDKSNPSFKIINVDHENFDVIDTQEWTFNLTEANLAEDAIPDWYKLYSFRESFGTRSLAHEEFSELLPKMAANHNLLDDYHKFRYRNSDVAMESGCDNSCKKNYLCEIATSQVGDSTQCDILSKIFDQNV